MIKLADLLPEMAREGSYALVCHQHLLPSVVSLFEFVTEHVASAEHTWIVGKPYSTIQGAKERLVGMGIQVWDQHSCFDRGAYSRCISGDLVKMWQLVGAKLAGDKVEKIIVVDEGGFLAATVPKSLSGKVVVVEQTTFGTKASQHRLPTVQVALSVAKREFETPTIAAAVVARLGALVGDLNGVRLGIIGLGPVGRDLARRCVSVGLSTLTYDQDPRIVPGIAGARRCLTLKEVVDGSDVIIGCAGSDCMPPEMLPGDRSLHFASASSADVEFNRLIVLGKAQSDDLLAPIQVRVGGRIRHTLLNGGFPLNFDCQREHEPAQAMLLTRTLMAAGIVQASGMECGVAAGPAMLHASWQQEIVRRWASLTGVVRPRDIPSSPEWWMGQSRSFE